MIYVNWQNTIVPHHPRNIKIAHPFVLIYSNVCDLHQTIVYLQQNGFSRLLMIVPALHRFFMKQKFEVFTLFVKFFHVVKTQFGKSIKRLRSDNGREYVNHGMSKFSFKNGVVHMNLLMWIHHNLALLKEKIGIFFWALLFQLNVPKSCWGEAVLTAANLIYILSSRVLDGLRPIEFISSFSSIPFLSSLQNRVFGCLVFVHIHS